MRFLAKNRVVLAIENISNRNQAESLVGTVFYVKKADLPQKNDGEFYPSDLIGRKVQVIGTDIKCLIANVENFGAGDLIEISHKNGKFLVPFTRENFPDSGDEIFITVEAFDGFKS
jgi:16S rRNA processing protein RimM